MEFQDGINYSAGLCVSGDLGTGFDGDADKTTLKNDEVIELGFSYRCFEGCNYVNIEVLLTGV